MTPPAGDDQLLLIRCPSCGQRFKVGEDLKGKTVECGACEHRFRIGDEVIMRGRKFYPGENKNPALNRFQRVPIAVESQSPGEAAYYSPPPPPTSYEPASPQRILAGIAGGAVMVITALFLMLGSGYGGALSGMDTFSRLTVAVFVAVVGLALLLYANPRSRMRTLLFGGLVAACLVCVPFVFKKGADVGTVPNGSAQTEQGNPTSRTAPDEAEKIREKVGWDPVNQENQRLEKEGKTWKVSSLWIRNLREQNKIQVRDYLTRAALMPVPPSLYPRGGGDFLAVLDKVEVPMEKLRAIAEPIGTIKMENAELQLVEVEVDNDTFADIPMEKLTDAASPAFYDLNKNELSNIDPDRIKRAVVRLAGVEPKLFRPDISRKLVELLRMPGIEFKPEIARALLVWAEAPGPAGEAALVEVQRLAAKNLTIPDDLAELVVKERPPGTNDTLIALWKNQPNRWEGYLGRLDASVETELLALLPETKGQSLKSLVRVLGRCGGKASADAIAAIDPGDDPELRVLIGKSREMIRERTSR